MSGDGVLILYTGKKYTALFIFILLFLVLAGACVRKGDDSAPVLNDGPVKRLEISGRILANSNSLWRSPSAMNSEGRCFQEVPARIQVNYTAIEGATVSVGLLKRRAVTDPDGRFVLPVYETDSFIFGTNEIRLEKSAWLATLEIEIPEKASTCTGEIRLEENSLSFSFYSRDEAGSLVSEQVAFRTGSIVALFVPGGKMRVTFIDVGQGDATFFEFPDGTTMLVDAGTSDAGNEKVVPTLRKLGITKINYLVATHADSDHIGGMATVVRNFEIGEVLDNGLVHTTQTYEGFLSAISEKGITFRKAERDEVLSSTGSVEVRVLHTGGDFPETSMNENSVVMLITFGKMKILMTGDIEENGEELILSRYGDSIKSTVIKVPHHGSSGAVNLSFISKVSPHYAVFSYGAGNSYGHPHQITLERYRENGATILETALSGTITMLVHPDTIEVLLER